MTFVPSVFFGYVVQQLENLVQQTEQAIGEATDAYALAGVSLALVGVSEAQVYQAVPAMNARTVRRVLAGVSDTVRMCMSDTSLEQTNTLGHLENGVLAEVQQLAERAKVRPQIAMSAVTRYLNSPERVTKVLKDLATLQAENCRIWNPTGLFTRLMRSGGDVVLPASAQNAQEEASKAKQARESRPVAAPGVLVKLYGEVCEILEVSRQFALVRTTVDDIRVSLDALRFHQPAQSV